MKNVKHLWHWGGLSAAALAVAASVAFVLLPRDVVVVRPVHGTAVQAVYATGTVEPSIMMPIAPRIGARLVELDVDEGADVRKGQVLARLESEDVTSNLRQLEAREDFARRDYQRYAAMLKQGIIARQLYDRAKADWQAARAATAQARAQAGFMTLTALDFGRVIRRDGEIGQLIPANQPVFWIAGRSAIRISADVDEEDVARLRVGQAALIRADAFPGRIFEGHVLSITPKGDPVARSYRVRISVPKDCPLLIGMTAETNIVVRRTEHALLLPSAAVDAGTLWMLRGGRLVRVKVGVGAVGADKTEIVSGVSTRDLVVADPDSSLKEGAKAHAVVVRSTP
ncbi:MAG TPA: efflux RND transporter periplasmic adaptor subunit [Rhizomicrobium sp.]|nr:efflux RND transporter periplasmic adaptor subunit [Rhizomicrobium sp.]